MGTMQNRDGDDTLRGSDFDRSPVGGLPPNDPMAPFIAAGLPPALAAQLRNYAHLFQGAGPASSPMPPGRPAPSAAPARAPMPPTPYAGPAPGIGSQSVPASQMSSAPLPNAMMTGGDDPLLAAVISQYLGGVGLPEPAMGGAPAQPMLAMGAGAQDMGYRRGVDAVGGPRVAQSGAPNHADMGPYARPVRRQ